MKAALWIPKIVQTSDDDKQLPLVAAHTNVLDRAIQYLRFTLIDWVDGALEQRRHKLLFIWEPIVDARCGSDTRGVFGF